MTLSGSPDLLLTASCSFWHLQSQPTLTEMTFQPPSSPESQLTEQEQRLIRRKP